MKVNELVEEGKDEENAVPVAVDDGAGDEALATQLQEESEATDDSEDDLEREVLNALITQDHEKFEEILGDIDTEDGLMDVVEMIENHNERVKKYLQTVKDKYKKVRADNKEERDKQKKLEKSLEQGEKTKTEQAKTFNVVVEFEGNRYNIVVKATHTLKDLRMVLMLDHRNVFHSESFNKSLDYTLRGELMNDHGRRTMRAVSVNSRGWNIQNSDVIRVARRAAAKSKAMPAKSKAKSSGSGTQ